MTDYSRRGVLKGIAGGAVLLSSMGVASASDGREEFVVTARGNGVRKRLEREGIEVRGEIAGGGVLLVAAESESAVADVGGVRAVEPNAGYRLAGPVEEESAESDAADLTDYQWDKTEETTGAFAAHDEATGEGSTVAIIDTGIDTGHPDLTTRADRGGLFRADGEASPSGDPFVAGDTTIEANLAPDTEEIESYVYRGPPATREQAAAADVHSHGSHCAGIATADDGDEGGIVGTAPDAEAVPLRVFYWKKIENYPHDEDGDGEAEELTVTALYTTDFDILSAIDYAAEIGADAANMSLGGGVLKGSAHSSGEHVAYQRVVQRAVQRGTVVTASAGNAESNLQQGGYYTLPNSVPGAMSVTATGPSNELAFYSNYGTSDVDVGAPGGGYETLEKSLSPDTEWPYPTNLVLSTVPGYLNDGAQYDWYAGTSMAAPQVAGLVALVREVNPDLNAKQVQQVIERTARFSNGSSSPELGAGIVYAPDAVAEASKPKGGK